jgi:glutathione synthase/RimK-type ligase-like ATP-grasp enzyme
MPAVLLATCAELPDGDEDGAILLAALADRGVSASWVAWTDAAVDWSSALVVLRSTWDYTANRDAFLTWVDQLPRSANDAAVVHWNTDKVYLDDLAAAGVPTVPTAVVRPGERVVFPDGIAEFVVKPSVGAGSRGAGRFTADRLAAAAEHAAQLHAADRTVLVQPYLGAVDVAGETALIYVEGEFSHAVRKGPMLPAGVAHPVHGWDLFVEEEISARVPDQAELAVGSAALGVIRARFGADQLYARVDLLPTPDGPVVVELELTEPSLFLQVGQPGTDPAVTFAAAIAERA